MVRRALEDTDGTPRAWEDGMNTTTTTKHVVQLLARVRDICCSPGEGQSVGYAVVWADARGVWKDYTRGMIGADAACAALAALAAEVIS